MSSTTKQPEAEIILSNDEKYTQEKEVIHAKARANAVTVVESNVFTQMLAAAKDIDVEKLKSLQGMFERSQDREAKRLFAEDFVRMQPRLPRVIKLKDNTQTKSKYAPLEDINKTVMPILEEFGFGTSMIVTEQNKDGVKVKTMLWHKSGHVEETVVYVPIDDRGIAGSVNKTQPHAHKSSITYARCTGICALLNISTGDDTDGNVPSDCITLEVAEVIKEKIAKFEPEYTGKFLAYMKAESVEAILAKHTKKAFTAIESKADAFAAAEKQKGDKK